MPRRTVKKNGELSRPKGPAKGDPRCKTARKGQPARNLDAIAKMKAALAEKGLLSPRPAWRPSKYRPEMCEEIIEFCSEGRALSSFAAKIEVPYQTLTQWSAKFPDFRAALQVAKMKAAAWHDEHGTKIVARGDRGGQGAMAKFYLERHAREEFGPVPAGPSIAVVNVTADRARGLGAQGSIDLFRAVLRGEPLPPLIEGEVSDSQDGE